MSAEISDLKIINGNILCGKISITPAIERKMCFPPKISNPSSCITFCDIYSDYSSLESECKKALVDRNNYYFYSSIGTCIAKLTNTRKNNNFGTIRPKKISWKFLSEIKIKNIEGFKSYFVFNKYPAMYELCDENNQKNLIEDDFRLFKDTNDNLDQITCFVSKNIIDAISKYNIEFPFKDFVVMENVIPNTIEVLMGKIVSSGNSFYHGIIHSTTNDNKDNDTLHAEYIDKSIDFQALRGGIVEFNSSKEIHNGYFVIFYKYEIKNVFINDKQIEITHSTYNKFSKITIISTILNDCDIIKYNSKKFISDSKNAVKIHYYKFTSTEEILDISQNDISKEHFDIIKSVGKNAISNIRYLLSTLEEKDHYNFIEPRPPQLGRDISDATYIGKMVSSCVSNNNFLKY